MELGANPLTFQGLSGMGDLILTCTGSLSRNRRVGIELGQGKTLAEIIAGMDEVAEGVKTTYAVCRLAERLGVEMPIAEAVRERARRARRSRRRPGSRCSRASSAPSSNKPNAFGTLESCERVPIDTGEAPAV